MVSQGRYTCFLRVGVCVIVFSLWAGEKPEAIAQAPSSASQAVVFEAIANQAGLRFQHINGATPEKYTPESMGAGGLFFDYNQDGWLDIFIVDSGSLVDEELAARAHSVLYENNGDGTFRDVTAEAGLKNPHYGMGACAADYDNDGYVDLYLTNFGPNILYRNNGDGTFANVTQAAGVGSGLWSTSCAFGDIDNDGDLDLYVANYVDFDVENNKYCGDPEGRMRTYCHPHVYNGVPDKLYRNNSDGTFTDITREAGVYSTAGKGLGVVCGDYNNDGWIDIYVANDSVPNFLYRNEGNGRFKEVGMWSGVAVNAYGRSEAGMGVAMEDFDNDGLLDVFVTNYDIETNTLYRNMGAGFFRDVTLESGHAEPSLRFVGFGTGFFDFDNDGDLDVMVANGHVVDNIEAYRKNITHAQRNLLFRNEGGGVFREVGVASGAGLALEKVSRGLALGDIDNDGDLDVLITNNGQTVDLLRNDGGNRMNSLLVRVIGTKSNRDGIGARVKLTIGSTTYLRQVKSGSSYLGQNDLRVHFGLGEASCINRLEVRWPSGIVDAAGDLEANQIITVLEGKGIVRAEPLRTSKQLKQPCKSQPARKASEEGDIRR